MAESEANTQKRYTRARKLWWLLPVAILFLLIVVIYVLVQLSRTNSEMYPTTESWGGPTAVRLC